MPTQKKIFTVQNLTQKLKDAKALILVDYRGLSVSQMSDLRKEIKKTESELEVVKNRLLSQAAKEARVTIDNKALLGPTAVLWIWKDKISPIKTLYEFIQKVDLPKIKFGLLQGRAISLERIKELASLPTIEQLKAKLVSRLQSPIYGLTNALNWNVRGLIFILEQESRRARE